MDEIKVVWTYEVVLFDDAAEFSGELRVVLESLDLLRAEAHCHKW